VLREDFEPAPLAGPVRPGEVGGDGLAKREECAECVVNPRGVGENQRLALPLEPEFRVDAGPVQVAVQFAHHIGRVAKGAQERDLRRAGTGGAHLSEGLAQREIVVLVRRLVGHVENNDIGACVGQHARVLLEHVCVVGQIVAEQRFAPVVKRMHGPPGRVIRLLHGVRILLENSGDVMRAGLAVRAQPQEVENAHVLAVARVAGLGVRGQAAPEVVHRFPGVAEHVRLRLIAPDLRGKREQRRKEDSEAVSLHAVVSFYHRARTCACAQTPQSFTPVSRPDLRCEKSHCSASSCA